MVLNPFLFVGFLKSLECLIICSLKHVDCRCYALGRVQANINYANKLYL